MGVVVAARDLTLHREVAIKLILPELLGDKNMARRFLREARITANLKHPSVVTVYAAGIDSGDRLYIVQELLAGCTLADRLDLPMMITPKFALEHMVVI